MPSSFVSQLALLVAPADADHAAPEVAGDLHGQRSGRTGCRGDDHGLARLRLADVDDAHPRGRSDGAVDAHHGRRFRTGRQRVGHLVVI